MSVCTFLASDYPLPDVTPTKDYPINIDLDNGTIYDGGADDNFFLHSFDAVKSYTDKKYGVWLEWNYYTDGRAEKIVEYIKEILKHTDSVELWHVWLMDYYEYDERPKIKKCELSVEELRADDIKELDDAEIWKVRDSFSGIYDNRPIFYCLKISR